MSGSQFCHRAQERMMRRNPIARTNDSSMTAAQHQCVSTGSAEKHPRYALRNPATIMVYGREYKGG